MAYVGNKPDVNYTSFQKQDLTGATGGTLTLSTPVTNANEIQLFINHVRQESGTSYTASGTTVTLQGYTVSASDDIYVIYHQAFQTTQPPDGSVNSAKLVDDAVTSAKISDNNITTAKIANNAVGSTQLAQANVGWEHIETKVWASEGSANDGTGLTKFKECFSTSYITYKLIIGRLQPNTTNGQDFLLRLATGTGGTFTEQSEADTYYWGMTRVKVAGSHDSTYTNGDTVGVFWKDWWSSGGSGIHGEIDFYNMTAPVINSVNTDKGSTYRPMMKFDMLGYNQVSNSYERQIGLIRWNTSSPDDFITGFLLNTTGNCETGTHMSLFGLRSPV